MRFFIEIRKWNDAFGGIYGARPGDVGQGINESVSVMPGFMPGIDAFATLLRSEMP
ncbi:MAG TPA: hypothetical protein VH040_14890 [Usitatibacter sp.]|jgi:hypothetical protein|nr:hypothetical protein [Usitatibacter sp.]